MKPVFLVLIALACLSPTLTLLSLWQVKEWRTDRLLDHLKTEGWWRQLWGKVRPMILVLWTTIGIAGVILRSEEFLTSASLGLLATLSLLSIVQILRRQRMPVWTMKAMILLCVSLLIPVGISLAIPDQYTGLIPYLTPLWVATAWMLFKPFDMALKYRVLSRAMRLRAAYPDVTVIGITGSVGKTTTKELLAHILKSNNAIATPLHVNTEMGVAAWITKILSKEPADSKKILIVEMGAYRIGEIKLLCDIAKPTLGIITYIGRQHVSLFGSPEAIMQSKGELFDALPSSGHAFWNHDNEASAELPKRCRCPVTSVGTDGRATLNALDIEETGTGLKFSVEGTSFVVPIAGTHTVTSILLAVAAAKHLGMTLTEISRALQNFSGLPQTFEVKSVRGVTVLDDTYNASPDSFQAALRWAAQQPQKEKVLLTDGIIELGMEEEAIHRQLAEQAASVFSTVYIGNTRVRAYFSAAFGDRVKSMDAPRQLNAGSLLVCVGRVQKSAIDQLLPHE